MLVTITDSIAQSRQISQCLDGWSTGNGHYSVIAGKKCLSLILVEWRSHIGFLNKHLHLNPLNLMYTFLTPYVLFLQKKIVYFRNYQTSYIFIRVLTYPSFRRNINFFSLAFPNEFNFCYTMIFDQICWWFAAICWWFAAIVVI